MGTQLTPENTHFFQFRLTQIKKTLKIIEDLQQSIIDYQAWNELQAPEDRLDLESFQAAWCEANRILLLEVQGQGCQVSFDRLVKLLQS